MFNTVMDSREAEAYAFHWAIITAAELLLLYTFFETDCLKLVQHWKQKEVSGRSLFHGIVADCRRLTVS